MSPQTRILIVAALLLAAPYPVLLALGWEVDLGMISGPAPTADALLHGLLLTLARLTFVLLAPVLALAAAWRALLGLVAGWTLGAPPHTLDP